MLEKLNELNNEEFNNLSDEEKRKIIIEKLKKDRNRFIKIKHIGNKTINNYGTKFKKERKRKNVQARKSRKRNRK